MTITSWREVDGDNTLALDWPLDENSHVWEIGGYEGRWVQQIWDKFHCHITVFEPQGWAVEKMQERFKENPKIAIHPYGLWTQHEWLRMGDYFTDGASVMKSADSDHRLEFASINTELDDFKPEIDLCLMNIEGAEFVLIPLLIHSGKISRFKRFWCQFHEFAVQFDTTLGEDLFKSIERTHDRIWDHYPTAVAWERR